jgi:Cd2+-exporting ATPase
MEANQANLMGNSTGYDASCCTKETICSRQKPKPMTRCLDLSAFNQPTDSSHEDKCCSGKELARPSSVVTKLELDPEIPVSSQSADVEMGAAREHVVFHVAGMTCTGCDVKLSRVLQAIRGVSNIRVTFVTGTADFDLDPSECSAEDVLRQLQRSTGFAFSRVSAEGQSLDVLMDRSTAKALSDKMVTKIHGIEMLDRKTARITYNPTVVGARELMVSLRDRTSGPAPPTVDASLSGGRRRLYDMLIKVVLATCLTIPVVVLAWSDTSVNQHTKIYISICLVTVVQLLAIPEFYRPAISLLIRRRVIELDMLVVISITAAYFYSAAAVGFTLAGKPFEVKEFFEISSLLITLVLLGRLVAAFARIRAVEAVSVRSLQASTAVLISDGHIQEIDARLLQFGDQFQVAAHTQIPTDGVVLEGTSEVDESMLTGENLPARKSTGDKLIAGTLNGTGVLRGCVSRLPGRIPSPTLPVRWKKP